MLDTLVQKIQSQQATVGIVGLGYVGLPLALCFAEKGYSVIGFDVDSYKINKLKEGKTYIEHISSLQIQKVLQSNKLLVTADFQKISHVDVIILCVPTPLNKYREPDLSFVLTTVDTILPYLRSGQILSLESTTYPGTTEEELRPRIVSAGLVIGKDFFLVFSPEREDPGNIHFNTKTIPKVVGGSTYTCLEAGKVLYGAVVDRVVPVSSTRAAEMTKLLENIHRAVNIGLVNEMKIVCDRMGIDIHEVVDAAATKPFGFVPYYPGPGIGGHCIPIDPFYLTWKAREFGVHTRFIEIAGEINSYMPSYVFEKISQALNERCKSVRGSKILILGISYKRNIDDMRESPSVFLMEKLRTSGADLDYHDPHVPIFPKMREHYFNLSSQRLDAEMLKKYDCVVLATDHDQFNYQLILENSRLIVDTRGKYRLNSSNLVKA